MILDRAPNSQDDFFWGVATSAYQSEGGMNAPGQPETNWAILERKEKVQKLGTAADFWSRYEEDFANCRGLGFNAFRLGISWSRIQQAPPDFAPGDTPPPFNQAALEHYGKILLACQNAGLEPILTLQHFTHPSWLGPDAWLDDKCPTLFNQFVAHSISFLNQYLLQRQGKVLRWFITINEPNMLVLNSYVGTQFPAGHLPGVTAPTQAFNNLLRAHILAYNSLHDLYEKNGWDPPMVTFNNYCSDLYWADKFLLDIAVSRSRGITPDNIQPYLYQKEKEFEAARKNANIDIRRDIAWGIGSLFRTFASALLSKKATPKSFLPALTELANAKRSTVMDYIGLDYYDPFMAHLFRFPQFKDHEFKSPSLRALMLNAVTAKWWDWKVLPQGLHFFCKYYSQDFDNLQVLIAENGMALRRTLDNKTSPRRDSMTRSNFLRLHIHEVTRIVNEGIPLIGYLHWSLFDNYEWGSYAPRFGLYSIDYAQSTDRLLHDHTGDSPSESYKKLILEARGKQKPVQIRYKSS